MAITSNDAIEERRKEIQRRRKEQKLKRKKAAVRRLLILLSVLLVIILAILSLTVFFPVAKIMVENNNTIYTSEQIINASGAKKGKNLWMTGFNAEKDIPVKLPYVSEVKVKRSLSSTIVITATPAKAVYSVQNKNEHYICDGEYKLLEIKNQAEQDLIALVGIEPQKTKAGSKVAFNDEEKFNAINNLLSALEQKSITPNLIDVSELMEIKIRVENRFNVQLGSSAYLNMKISHLAGMLKGTDKDIVGSIDLTDYTPENGKGILTRE